MSRNDLSAFTPQIWSKRILTRLDQKNVMLALANRVFEGDIREQGDTVWVRTFGNVTMSPYSRGGPIDYGTASPTKEALQILDASNFAFTVDDLDAAQNDINALDGYSGRAAVALNNAIESKLMSLYTRALPANQIGAGGVIAIDATNAYSNLVLAGQLLDQQNVEADGRWIVVTPAYKASLLLDAKYFIRATDLGDMIVKSGRIGATAKGAANYLGQGAGFDVYWSNVTPKDGGGRYNFFGGKVGGISPLSYAGQIRRVETIRRESTWATAVRGLLLHDATVFAEHARAVGTIYSTL